MDFNQVEFPFKNLNHSNAITHPQLTLKKDKNEVKATKIKKITMTFLLTSLATIISALLLVYIVYSSYKYTVKPANIEDIPLARREIGPLRIIPSDIGGEQFLNQDKLIYNNLESPELKGIKKQVIENTQKHDNPVIKAASKNMAVDTENEKKQTKLEQQNLGSNNNTSLATKQTQGNKITKNPTKQNKKTDMNSVFDVLN